jgi:hypothetical protein
LAEPVRLETLLGALAAQGLRLPVDQRDQLAWVLAAAAHDLQEAGREAEEGLLERLVVAVVARTPEQARQVHEAVRSIRPVEQVPWEDRPEVRPPPQRRWGPAVVVLAALAAAWWVRPPPAETPSPVNEPQVATQEPQPDPEAPPTPEEAPRRMTFPVPELQLSPTPPDRRPELLLLAAALAALLLALRPPRPPVSPPRPPPLRLPRSAPSAPPSTRPVLLAPADCSALAWGLGREELPDHTGVLDVPRTLRATAAGAGIPSLHFVPSTRPIVVGLWGDPNAGPQPGRHLDEIAGVLQAHGLPFERGWYDPTRDLLYDAAHHRLPRSQLDALETSRLALFTTPEALRPVLADDGPALRRLSAHPEALIVCAGDPWVDDQLAAWRLRRVDPDHAAQALSDPAARPRAAHAPDPGPVWAARCCLSPVDLPYRVAWDLVADLPAGPSAWASLTRLLPEANSRIVVDDDARAAHLGRLSARTRPGELAGALMPAREILVAWLDAEVDGYRARDPELRSTEALRRRLWRALLDLWLADPGPAVHALLAVIGAGDAGVTDELHQRVARLVPHDVPVAEARERGLIRLPWTRAQAAAVAAELRVLRLGHGWGELFPPERVRAGRRTVGRGLLVGGSVAVLAVALWPRQGDPDSVTWSLPDAASEPLLYSVIPAVSQGDAAGSRGSVSAIGRFVSSELGGWTSEDLPLTATFTWGSVELECRIDSGDHVELRCPSDGALRRPSSGRAPFSSVWILAAEDEATPWAQALLDSGSADVVHILPAGDARLPAGGAWPDAITARCQDIPCQGGPDDGVREQLLVVAPGRVGPSDVPAGAWVIGGEITPEVILQAAGPSTIEEMFPGDLLVRGAAPFVVLPPPAQECARDDGWPAEPDPLDLSPIARAVRCAARDPGGWRQPVVWAKVPAGTWTIGSARDDARAYKDERDPWTITLPGFEILRTEVTAGWYRARMGKDGLYEAKATDWPVRGVNWSEAQAFCEELGGRLPSEAEWEVATRAGTTTAWSFGDSDTKVKEYAWYGQDYGTKPHGVALLRPNPWGLYDVHGNLYEWTASCYDENGYAIGPDVDTAKVDPTLLTSEGASCPRALRGGAFWLEPWFLRSANRSRDGPALRDVSIGFRCVRGAARQLDP